MPMEQVSHNQTRPNAPRPEGSRGKKAQSQRERRVRVSKDEVRCDVNTSPGSNEACKDTKTHT